MRLSALLSRLFPTAPITNRRHAPNTKNPLRTLEILEDRAQPSAAPLSLGSAANFGVLGLQATSITSDSTIAGNVGVSLLGTFIGTGNSHITGDVDEHLLGVYLGSAPGGHVVVNSAMLNQADTDAKSASSAGAALAPTQTFGSISSPTTVLGSGGLNVISIRGDITSSLILNGTASDIFIVNLTGSLRLQGTSALGLGGSVTADHVIYNFVGSSGQLSAGAGNVINGTILAPKSSVNFAGTQVNGEIIGGGTLVSLGNGTAVNSVAFNSTPVVIANASLSGCAFVDYNGNGVQDSGDNAYSNIMVTLTGVDNLGKSVSFTTQTDANGDYTFAGLSAGTYSVTFSPPPSGGTAVAGDVGGTSDGTVQNGNTIGNIALTSNSVGTDFNFAVTAAAS
jgi:choice-of-anchor A domain-containing protein